MTLRSRIALIDTQGRLCTCERDGSDYRELTRPDRVYQFPAWSPDGSAIAAIGSDRRGTGVYYFEDDPEGAQWQLYRSWLGARKSPFYLCWSPDSQTVSFIANHPMHGIAFYLVTPEAQATAEHVASGQPFFWQWDQDSAEIFVHSGVSDANRLAFIKPFKGGDSADNHAPPGHFQSPGISYSGRYLAYSTMRDSEQAALAIEAVRTGETTYIEHHGSTVFSWNPKRNQLAYMSPQTDARHYFGPLMLTDPFGKTSRLTPYPVLAFFWSPDGNKLAYLTPTANDSLFELASSGKIAFKNGHKPPSMSRTVTKQSEQIELNLWVVDLQHRTRQSIRKFRPTRLFLNQFLPFFDQYAHSHRLWSADSSALVLPLAKGASQREITVIPVNGDAPTVLGKGLMGFWQP